jgi:hypothetical protein
MTKRVLALALFLASCASACAPVAPSQSQIATAVAELAAHASLTASAAPSATSTFGPSPTPTHTPLPAQAIEATQAALLTGPHADGVYQVGVTIATGVWRSIPQDQDRFCYWARRKYDGILLGSHYGAAGVDILIRPEDFEVEFDGCGVWVYMGER